MNKILELLKHEIDETNSSPKSGYGTTALLNNTHSDGYVSGIEKAIEIIKVQAAIEVVEGSIMHGKKKYREGEEDDDLEDKSGDEYTWECNLCGAEDGKCDYKCPNNDSPYAQLIQNGYD